MGRRGSRTVRCGTMSEGPFPLQIEPLGRKRLHKQRDAADDKIGGQQVASTKLEKTGMRMKTMPSTILNTPATVPIEHAI